jgi:hypothetical protein
MPSITGERRAFLSCTYIDISASPKATPFRSTARKLIRHSPAAFQKLDADFPTEGVDTDSNEEEVMK